MGKNYMAAQFVLLSLLFFCASPVYPEEADLGSIFFDKAVNEYLEGNRDAAITSLEKSVKYKPGNQDAKRLLARLLVLRGSEYFYNNETDKSFIDLKEAKECLPDDAQVDKLYTFVKAAFESGFKTAGAKPLTGPEQKDLVKFLSGIFLKDRGGLVPPVAGSAGLPWLSLPLMGSGFALLVLFFMFAIYRSMEKYSAVRKDEIFAQRVQVERLMHAIRHAGKHNKEIAQLDPAAAAAMLLGSGLSRAPEEMSHILNNPGPGVRAKGLMIMEAEMLSNKKSTALKILEPMMSDPDPIIRANAARAVCGHDMGRGMPVLEKMALGRERAPKIAALHAMGWIMNDRPAKLLTNALNDRDGMAGSAALKSLARMRERSYSGLSKNTAAEAERALSLMLLKQPVRKI